MPKISALSTISQLTTSSILPVVDGNETQKVTLERVIEFVSASLDVTFTTEIELMRSASSITSSLNEFATASNLLANQKLSTSSYNTDSASFNIRINNISVDTSSLVLSSTFNTYTSSNDSKVNSLINKTGSYATTGSNVFKAGQTIGGNLFLSASNPLLYNTGNTNAMLFGFFDGGTIYGPYYQIFGNQYSNTTQRGSAEFVFDSRNGGDNGFNVVELNNSTWVRKFRVNTNGAEVTGSLIVTNGITGSTNWDTIVNKPTLLSGSSQISSLGFATTSSLSDVTPFLSSSTFNTFTSSYKTDSSSFDSRITAATNEQDLSGLVTTSLFNSYTASNDSRVNSLINATSSYITSAQTSSFITESETGSFVTDVSMFLSKSIFDTYTSSLSGAISSSAQITSLGFATTSSVLNIDTSSLVTTSSFNSYTASISTASLVSRLNTIESVSGSWITESETGSFLTSLPNGVISGSSQLPSGLVSGSSQILNGSNILSSSAEGFTAFSESVNSRIASAGGGGSTDVSMFLSQSTFNTLTSSFTSYSSSINSYTSSMNSYTASINSTTASLNGKTGSYATTGSNQFKADQTITGSLTVTALTTISSSISANSSSLYLTSGSNLIVQNNGYVEVSGSQLISGSLTITGSLNISNSGSLGARLWQLSDVNDSLSGSITDGYMLSYSTGSNSWVTTAGATARGSIRLYMATNRSNASAFYFNANTRTASDSASPSSDTAFMVTTTLLNKVTVFLRQDAAGPNSTQIAIYKNANGSAFSSASQIATATLSLTQDTIQTYTFTGLTLNQFDSLHVYCDPTSTPGTLYAIVTVE